MAQCEQVIGFDELVRTEKRRGFQPPWYTVAVYKCSACGTSHYMSENWHGSRPPGAFVCNASKGGTE